MVRTAFRSGTVSKAESKYGIQFEAYLEQGGDKGLMQALRPWR